MYNAADRCFDVCPKYHMNIKVVTVVVLCIVYSAVYDGLTASVEF